MMQGTLTAHITSSNAISDFLQWQAKVLIRSSIGSLVSLASQAKERSLQERQLGTISVERQIE